MSFVHLHTHSPFSFLDGGSAVEELVIRAAEQDMPALGLTDHDNLCAAVKFCQAARKAGIKPVQGVELTLDGGGHLTLLARNHRAYASICSLLSRAHMDNPRGQPAAALRSLEELEEVIVLSGCRKGEINRLILQGQHQKACSRAREYLDILGKENFYIELQGGCLPGDSFLNHRLMELAEHLGIEMAASGNVHYARHQDFKVHDLLTCIRTLTRVQDIHPQRPLNGENYLKPVSELKKIFASFPRAVENTVRIARECEAVFGNNQTHLPRCSDLKGERPGQRLGRLVFEGARNRYGKVSRQVRERLERELEVIDKLGFADYFLVVEDVARYARSRGIRYAGRGSAADSLVVYCLYISEVDSLQRGLLFERFMSSERKGLPDIDIDFESRYRDQVIDYVYRRYGSERVARVATYNTFQARSAIRDLGKALGFPEEEIAAIAKQLPHIHADHIRKVLGTLPELKNSPLQEERFRLLLDVSEKIAGFPRFLGTHLGGVVISDVPLLELTPLQKSALGPVITQFDKDDVEELGLAKLDLLPLRTLSVISDAARCIQESGQPFNYEYIPLDDPASYEMINRGETIGVFQLESPAQRALQSHFNASHMEDMVASMALIRPGPIKGNMVEPYIARRHGREETTYLHPRLKPILEKTYGVVLFQEQVIEIAVAIAGFSPGEADRLRRVMTHARSEKVMQEIGTEFVEQAEKNGVDSDLAREIFACIRGYASYGFCEAHAAAFATTSFKTAYMLRHYPTEYYTAILNHQPMGFYPPYIICSEARRRGISILGPDVNASAADFRTEGKRAIRVGLKQVRGISRSDLQNIAEERAKSAFQSPLEFMERSRVNRDVMENLIKCGALDSLHENRRQMLMEVPVWMEEMQNRSNRAPVLFENQSGGGVPDFERREKELLERQILGLDIKSHLMAELRKELAERQIYSSREIKKMPHGKIVQTAGTLFRPHRPPTRSGKIVVFFSLVDEFGLIDISLFESAYMKYGEVIFGEQKAPILVKGKINRRGNGVSISAYRLSFLSK
jgi:error-prone DNA polymerase